MVCSVIVICTSAAKGNDETVAAEGNPFDFLTILLSVFSFCIGMWFIRTKRSSLPRRGYLDPAITPPMAMLLAAAMFILGGIGAWWGAARAPENTINALAWMYACAMIAQLPVLLVYARLRKRCGSRHVAEISLISFAVFVPMALATAGILHGVFSMIGIEPPSALGHELLATISESPWNGPIIVIVLCSTIGAGIFEEVLYRGLILPTFTAVLSGRTAWGAIVATSILFSIMHIGVAPPSALVGLFVLSLGLCWARVKSGGVLAPIVIHIVFNTMNIAFVYSTTL